MWQDIVISLLVGVIFGSAVGILNHWLVWSALKQSEQLSPAKARNKVMGRYLIRYAINFITLATYLWHKDTYILIGTALGLSLMGKFLAVKYSILKKEVKS
ncbi:MAG: ATP synthase subunit I [Bacillota bacterium]|jgi:hypothetical protein